MAKNISSLQCAYEFLRDSSERKTFYEIWEHVVKTLEIENPDEKISSFYTNLTLDGRFVIPEDEISGEKKWDLRSKNKLDNYYSEIRKYVYEEESEIEIEDSDEDSENKIEEEIESDL